MEAKKLSNEFMQHSAECAAWKEISTGYRLTEGMMEKYADKLDWKKVSENQQIHWNVQMLEKFKKRIDWHRFSKYAPSGILTPSTIEAFKELWDWDKLSDNNEFVMNDELLMTYKDRWNWSKIIDRYYINYLYNDYNYGITFYEKYKEYIPESKVQDSFLWRQIVAQARTQIIDGIMARG